MRTQRAASSKQAVRNLELSAVTPEYSVTVVPYMHMYMRMYLGT